MNKQRRWLRTEIAAWEKEGLVSPGQAATLLARYPGEEGGALWGLILFGSAAATAIGIGLILMIAHNWARIPRLGKLGFIFGALAAIHGAGAYFYRAGGWKKQVGEMLCLLGTFVFGAGIFLVAQVYHIDEHFPDGLLLWAAGALAFAWALDSLPQAIVALALLVGWSGSDILRFEQPDHSAFLFILVGVAPLAWRLRSVLLLGFVLAALNLDLAFMVSRFGSTASAFSAMLGFAALLVAGSKLCRMGGGRYAHFAPVLGCFGFAGVILVTYILSFALRSSPLGNEFWYAADDNVVKFAYCWTLFSLAMVAWLLVGVQSARAGVPARQAADWIVPLVTAFTFALFFGGFAMLKATGPHAYTLVLLVIAVSWMWRGSRTTGVVDALLGSLLLAALLIARYFDLFDSLAARGAAFLVLGVVFIAEAVYFRWNRRQGRPAGKAAP